MSNTEIEKDRMQDKANVIVDTLHTHTRIFI